MPSRLIPIAIARVGMLIMGLLIMGLLIMGLLIMGVRFSIAEKSYLTHLPLQPAC